LFVSIYTKNLAINILLTNEEAKGAGIDNNNIKRLATIGSL